MGDSTRQGRERHDEDAGAHGGLELIAQHAGEDEEHHHTAAGPHKAADQADDDTADDGLDRTLFRGDPLHGLFGGHDRLDNELDSQQERHKHREAAHRPRGNKACQPAAHHRESQHAGHHDEAVFHVQILILVVGVSGHRTGQNVRRKGNAHGHVGVHAQKRDEHGADDRRRTHPGKAGAKAGTHAGKKCNQKNIQNMHLNLPPQ